LLENLTAKGYEHATPIQAQTIPLVMAGNNVLGISATGSGKTAAFLTPIINKMILKPNQKLLVLAPTRELAMQIQKEAISMIRNTNIRAALVIGGESMYRQAQDLKRNPQIIIGTPGRLIDMYNRNHIDFSSIQNVVLDEVDRMLDMGFIPDVREIFSNIPKERQTLFFSATIENAVKKVVGELANSYETVTLSENKPIDSVWQDVVEYSDMDDKLTKLDDLLTSDEVLKTIVFVETKHFADKIEKLLRERGHSVAAIHGGKTQSRRTNVISMYKSNKVTILVATDVAARGLDISDISHIINFDEPQNYDSYIHRIGRTGRNGKKGVAYTFVKSQGGDRR
jgi:superfamily II DNA/RNA helicase